MDTVVSTGDVAVNEAVRALTLKEPKFLWGRMRENL